MRLSLLCRPYLASRNGLSAQRPSPWPPIGSLPERRRLRGRGGLRPGAGSDSGERGLQAGLCRGAGHLQAVRGSCEKQLGRPRLSSKPASGKSWKLKQPFYSDRRKKK